MFCFLLGVNLMRIGVNCFLLRPDIGGMKQYFHTLLRELLTNDLGNKYILFHYPCNEEELANIGTDRWKADAIALNNQLEVKQHLDKIDLYFCPFSAIWPRPVMKPTVMTIPDIQEVHYPEFFTTIDKFNRDWHYLGSTRMADRVITISEFSKSTIVKFHSISTDKVVAVHLAADQRYYNNSKTANPQYPLPDNFILYPANRWKHKNHENLLKALHILRYQRDISIHAVFTGYDVPNGYQLAEMASKYGVGDLVHQVGYLLVDEMAYLYSKARALVFPSLYEGFGIPLVEAMAVGCPIVCSNQTSLPEIAENAAIYFDPTAPEDIAESILKVWNDNILRDKLVENGKCRSLNFSAAKMAEIHKAVFEEAIRAYSPYRYWWNYIFYQHYHQILVNLKLKLGLYS